MGLVQFLLWNESRQVILMVLKLSGHEFLVFTLLLYSNTGFHATGISIGAPRCRAPDGRCTKETGGFWVTVTSKILPCLWSNNINLS